MLQWRPGSTEEIIWNDQEDGQFVSRILNVKTGKTRTLPKAIYALSPDGKFAVGTEFNRIQNMRPGYGYPGIPDPYASEKAPQDIGIYRMDLDTGEQQLIISLAHTAALPHQGKSLTDKWHYFNHLLVSPDSQRFIFLHRWRDAPANTPAGASGGFTTRLFTADIQGEDLYMLDPSGYTSHFIWRDPQHICAWTKPEGKKEAFYLFKDKTEEVTIVGEDKMTVNGHNTYLPMSGNEWILNDTYPDKEDRQQTLYLYHVPTDRKVVLGRFFEPPHFKGEWRCDLHPRSSQDGTKVIFDSTHENNQRQMYMVDVSEIVS
jgi:Tol biopolymer transport system component